MSRDIPLDDLLRHIDLALEGMVATITDLGDELVNVRPELPGANTAFQIVNHCCGVMENWGANELFGRPTDRDRDAELRARGTVADLVSRVRAQRDRLAQDLQRFDGTAPALRAHEQDGFNQPERAAVATQGGVLVHVYEELAQHRGHLDITADLVTAMR